LPPNVQLSAAPLAGVWSEMRTGWRPPEAMGELPPSAGGMGAWREQNHVQLGTEQGG